MSTYMELAEPSQQQNKWPEDMCGWPKKCSYCGLLPHACTCRPCKRCKQHPMFCRCPKTPQRKTNDGVALPPSPDSNLSYREIMEKYKFREV